MDDAAVANWLEGYKRAWEHSDLEIVGGLFAPEATYQEKPFGDAMQGREAIVDYWRRGAVEAQKDISFGYDILSVSGDTAIAHWWAAFERVPSGSKVKLDGIFVLQFDGEGLCVSLKEWWHRLEGDR